MLLNSKDHQITFLIHSDSHTSKTPSLQTLFFEITMASTHKRILRTVAFIAIFFNYLQTFEGVLMVSYSFWMLNQWNNPAPSPPPPSTPAIFEFHDVLDSLKLPAPWFIYSFMGFGVVLCCVAFTGCYAAHTRKRCNICFHEFLVLILLSTEAVTVSYLRVDEQWEQNLPFDPTGQIETLRSFMETHAAVCRKIGFYTILIQVLCMVFGFIIRILMFIWDISLEENNDEKLGGGDSLLDPKYNDVWSFVMKEKDGSNKGEKYMLLIPNAGGKKYEV